MPDGGITQEAILHDYPRLSWTILSTSIAVAGGLLYHCCRDVSIVLTPYDVLRMKRALHLGLHRISGEAHDPGLHERSEASGCSAEDELRQTNAVHSLARKAAASMRTVPGHAACTRWVWQNPWALTLPSADSILSFVRTSAMDMGVGMVRSAPFASGSRASRSTLLK